MKKIILLLSSILLISTLGFVGCGEKEANAPIEVPTGKTLLEYGGRSSVKIISKDGTVIYVDPYTGDYSEEADLVLITHEHDDHNLINKIKQKDDTVVIRSRDSYVNDTYKKFEEKGIKIESVSAYNNNHPKGSGVGYIIEVDGIKIYHSGDTSKISEMNDLTVKNIDYALLPYDGEFNMGPDEMTECAKIIGAKNIIPMHGISKRPKDLTIDNLKVLSTNERIELIK